MTGSTISAAALQFHISMDVSRNLETLERLLDPLPPHALAVAPEGTLSGYLPEPGFVERIDVERTAQAIAAVEARCRRKKIHVIAGACIKDDDGAWRNSSLYFGPNGERARYDKINLAQSERGTFVAGGALPVFDVTVAGLPLRLGIQMCREIRYPEQWRALAVQGAQVFAYVNNAVGSKNGDALWRAHLVSRAAETQRFIIGANNAAPDQTCPTTIIAPTGETLATLPLGTEAAATASLDLGLVTDWVLSQARDDVVGVTLREKPSD
ncbi:MAG: carbon-nitrogen hydrolase family protein [Terricaulis sp.]